MRLIALVLCLAACGDDQQPEQAADLLARVRADDYQSWQRAPGYETRKRSNAPHSEAVDIYLDPTITSALGQAGLDAWPLGSLIVKDGFDGNDHELVAIMEKRPDGWFWAEYYDGESKYSGKPAVCTDCHDAGDDFVLAFDLP